MVQMQRIKVPTGNSKYNKTGWVVISKKFPKLWNYYMSSSGTCFLYKSRLVVALLLAESLNLYGSIKILKKERKEKKNKSVASRGKQRDGL